MKYFNCCQILALFPFVPVGPWSPCSPSSPYHKKKYICNTTNIKNNSCYNPFHDLIWLEENQQFQLLLLISEINIKWYCSIKNLGNKMVIWKSTIDIYETITKRSNIVWFFSSFSYKWNNLSSFLTKILWAKL